MPFLRVLAHKLFFFLYRHFSENRASKWQVALLMLFFMGLCWFKGVLVGILAAFFVYLVTPDGPERGWPAVITFFAVALSVGLFGTVKAWQMYKTKVAEIESFSATVKGH